MRFFVQLNPAPGVGAPNGPRRFYRPVVRAGDWLICSGQLGLESGKLVAGGAAAEVTQALANLAGFLEAEGSSLAAVAKTTVFLADIGDYPAMNEAYAAAFGDHLPARSAVAVAALPFGALVEVEAWAWAPLPLA
ncbi:MAG TPA: RidA family protein [Acidimicrobiales bacterium]|nr:RidA family protein [Acidimicrobiales bacterium]